MINESTTESEYLIQVYDAMLQLKRNTARKARADRMKRYCENPGVKSKQSDMMKRFWANPENRRKMLLIMKSPEYKRSVSEDLKGWHHYHRRKKEEEDGRRLE